MTIMVDKHYSNYITPNILLLIPLDINAVMLQFCAVIL